MTYDPDTAVPERAPDGLTKLDIRRLRTKYKKLKSNVIEAIIDDLADPSGKSSDIVNRFKIIENLEKLLGINSAPPDPEDISDTKTHLSKTIDTLKASMTDE